MSKRVTVVTRAGSALAGRGHDFSHPRDHRAAALRAEEHAGHLVAAGWQTSELEDSERRRVGAVDFNLAAPVERLGCRDYLEQPILVVVNVSVVAVVRRGQVAVLVVRIGIAKGVGELIFVVDDKGRADCLLRNSWRMLLLFCCDSAQ